VLARPTANFTFSGTCLNSPTQFNGNPNTGVRPVTSNSWNFGEGAVSASPNPTFTYLTAGTYSVSYSVITDIGCRSDTAVQAVTINPLPTGTISGTAPTCINAPEPTITFTGAQGTAP
ncbi:MAG: PKD domain-containing protein, partial [Sphingomonadales bacterium]